MAYKNYDRERDYTDKVRDYDRYIPPYDTAKDQEKSPIETEKFQSKVVLGHDLMRVEGTNEIVSELKSEVS